MNNILKAQYKRSFNRQRGATLHPFKKMFPHCSLIKFTGTPENIKEIKYFLPEGSFVKKEESGIFYLNTVKELFFLNHKEAKESPIIFKTYFIGKKMFICFRFSGFPVIFITPMSLCTHSKVLAIL